MMPALDEAWALGYFSAVVSILLFGVGLPSLVLQTIVPDDLRRIAHRHFRIMRWGLWFVGFFMAIALAFVWVLHPSQGPQVRLIPGVDVDQWLAAGLMTSAIVGVGGVWFLYRSHRRDRIIHSLQRRCIKRIRTGAAPDDTTLQDLQYLGEQAATRAEKHQVLEALGSLALEVQQRKTYCGDQLEGIVRALQASLQKTVDSQSLAEGVSVLARIVTSMPGTVAQPTNDVGLVLEALESLVQTAWNADGDRAAILILEAVESIAQAPDGLKFEAELALANLGATALEHRRYLIAADVLAKLEAAVRSGPTVDADGSTAYLGLVAHFRAHGAAARRRAMLGLEDVSFRPSRARCLREAQEFHYTHCLFDTADLLTMWIPDIG